jgi:UDP-N-acetylmuramoyl-L-alanyl-D-glutamate--2,6-diaminopimelate ligase
MGLAASAADVVIVTDDNPRSEDPQVIRQAVLAGIPQNATEVLEIGDRQLAIDKAVSLAGTGDCVIVLGKGHESGQEVAGVISPFDDRDVVRDALRKAGFQS